MTAFVDLSFEGPCAHLTLKRPDKLNALDRPMIDAFLDGARAIEASPEARVAILSGEGKAFCAGGDIAAWGGLQPLEMWRALKQYGAPVALIVYPREGHGDTLGNFHSVVSQEPWHGIDLRRRMFGFLRAAFAGEPDPLALARKDVPTP